MTLVLVIVFFTSVLDAHGQCNTIIRGTTMDALENKSLPFVAITSIAFDSEFVSDSLGKFEISNVCDSTYTISFSQKGYATQIATVRPNMNDSIFISMIPTSAMFKEVVVSESKNNTSATSIQTVITSDELNAIRGKTLGETLKMIPGLTTLNTGTTISKPIIQGLHSNRVLILNNGIRQEGQQWGNEHAPEIDLFIANNLTVVKGASGLEYGHDAIGGIILIESDDLIKTAGIHGSVDMITMTNGKQGVLSGSIEGCSKKIPALSARIQGTIHRSGDMYTPEYLLNNTGKSEYNYSAGAEYRHDKFKIEFFYSQFNTDIGIFSGSHLGNLTDLKNAIASEAPNDIVPFSYSIDRPKQHIEHELHKIKLSIFQKSNGKISIIYARQYNLRQEFDKHLPRNDSIALLNKPELNLEITTHSVDIRFDKQQRRGWTLKTGLNASLQKNTYEGRYFIPNYIQHSGGAYFIEQKRINKTQLEFGVRYDARQLQIYRYVNETLESPKHKFSNIAAQFGMLHAFSEALHATINAGTTWRAPQANELYSNGLHHGSASVEIGDSKITTEQAFNAASELTLDTKRIQCSILPFVHYNKDFIYLTPTMHATLTIRGAFPTFIYRQADVLMHGCDLYSNYQLDLQNTIHFKGSILRAQNLDISDYLIQMPADRCETGVTHQFKNNNHFQNNKIGIAVNYVNKQWRTPANSDYLRAPNAYFLINATAQTKILIRTLEIYLGISVDNLLNETYRDYMNRFRYFSDEVGRNIQVHLNMPIHKITNNEN